MDAFASADSGRISSYGYDGQEELVWRIGAVIMRIIEGFDFFPLTFGDRGTLESRQEFDLLTERASVLRPWTALGGSATCSAPSPAA